MEIKRLLDDLDGGALVFQTEHEQVRANCLRVDGVPGPDVHMLEDAGADFALLSLEARAYFKVLDEAPELIMYSQRDPRWRNEVYAGGLTFGEAGCYTVCVAMMLSLAGYTDTPPEVAAKLREAGCYDNPQYPANLTRPDRIVEPYPRMRYDGPVDVNKDGPLRWHDSAADMERFGIELAKGPTIIEADFRPGGPLNQHFVVAESLTPDGDLLIADPWDGTRTRLMERYAKDDWSLARALYGMRLLRVADN